MPNRITATDEDDPVVVAAGLRLAEELKDQARMELPMLRALLATPAPPQEISRLAS
ncbi:hypothetical protein [Kribbella deserti]|uniref:Uncharacterized protein n=1 Tax=Kribbella deserti TaxID=1926257 RepID=A0ABV6QGN5_9ACTN